MHSYTCEVRSISFNIGIELHDCVTLVLLVRGVELTVVLPLREAHVEDGEVTHNHQLEKSCFAAQILTSSAQVIIT